MSNVNHWDGVKPLVPGMVVRYNGSQNSEFYVLPEIGELLTLIAEDIQMGFNPVWICRWYDEAGRVNLIPLLAWVLAPAEEPIDPRAQSVADDYELETGFELDVKVLEKCLASLLAPKHNEVLPKEDSDYLEVTFLGDGNFAALQNVDFPVTIRLSKQDYRLCKGSSPGIEILGLILNFIPGVRSTASFTDASYYLFYKYLEVLYKE